MPSRPGKFAMVPFRLVGLLAPKRPSLLDRFGTAQAGRAWAYQTSVGPTRFDSSDVLAFACAEFRELYPFRERGAGGQRWSQR
jgi:hypothetical protein